MTALSNGSFFGQFTRAFTQDQLDTIRGYERGLGAVPLAQALQFPSSVFPIHISLGADPNNNTVDSLPYKIPFPVKCWGVEMGCISAASPTATGDIIRDPVGAAGAASLFTSAKDIKGPAGAFTRYAPEVGSELWSFDDTVLFRVISGGGAGAVVGARAVLWVQMR